ncbi:MAG: hypothetical protein IT547_17720 [Hyphomonadaceae bacterium]|nr:hypothetical protein [Hyphomonadaceae bacterium]
MNAHFGGDRPVENAKDDRLGFTASAEHVADAILRFASPEGFVLGLEGAWGAGKSSYVNLIISALLKADAPPQTVKFSPWLISSRDGLLMELFREIGQAALKIDLVPDETEMPAGFLDSLRGKARALDRSAQRKRLRRNLAAFAGSLSRVGKLAEMAEVLGVPYAGLAGRGMQAAGNASTAWGEGPSLEAEKETLKAELRKLSRKIVVFVDDLDRLEPAEASEVVRLVRAVADFPNIVYVLCYSRPVLAESLSKALVLENGAAYIDKIVQVAFSVPRPEDFDLRRMFRSEVEALFPTALRETENAEGRLRHHRFATVIDIEGGKSLSTPRDVVRAVNALRLYAGPMIEKIDLADMVWLQLIRVRDTELYDWIETYVNNVAAIHGGARVGDGEAALMLNKLVALLGKDGRDVDDQMHDLGQVLVGISRAARPQSSSGANWALFQQISRKDIAAHIADKRLCSPHHFRLYFALAKPAGALDDAEFESLIANASANPDEAVAAFTKLADTPRPQGGVMAEAVISRLDGNGVNSLPQEALPGLLKCLVSAMDVAARRSGPGDLGRYWIWDSAERVLETAFRRLTPEQRSTVTPEIFATGASLGWLVDIFRGEIFDQGRYGDRAKPEDERLLTPSEFDAVVEAMQARFAAADPAALQNTLRFLSLLFAWRQSSTEGESAVNAWVADRIKSDAGLLEFLERVRSWGASGDQIYYPLQASHLKPFLDYDAARARVEALTTSNDHTIAAHAKRLATAFRQGENE